MKESNSLENIKNLKDLKDLVATKSIFSILDNQVKNNKLMFVGGCVRKLLTSQ